MIRTTLIFVLAFLVIRIRGQHQLGQLSLFDTIMVIALGSAVGDVMIYPESTVSLTHSAVAIVTLALLITGIENLLTHAPKRVANTVYGNELMLAYEGILIKENFAKTNLTEDQLMSRLREKGVASLSEIKLVRLEPDGDLSIVPYPTEDPARI